jgi:hypothetical protein
MESGLQKIASSSFVLILLFALILIPIPKALSKELSVTEKTLIYLTDVVGLDLEKYNMTCSEHVVTLSDSGPLSVNLFFLEQQVWVKLESKVSNVTVSCHFKDGRIEFCRLNFDGSLMYVQSPVSDAKQTTETLLQKYQNYVTQNYDINASYIEQTKSMLRSIDKIEPLTQEEDNIKFEISISTEKETDIKWIYTENGVEIPQKHIQIQFDQNNSLLYFRDTWSLYTIGTLDTISEEEAVSLALEAAENSNYEFIINDENIVEIKPDLTNVTYDAWLSMFPRDSDKLYPYWQIVFYFEKPIYNELGIHVALWGDTKEIVRCNSFGTLGTPIPQESFDMPQDEEQFTILPIDTPDNSNAQDNQAPINLLIVVSIVLAITFMFGMTIYKREKIKSQHQSQTSNKS